MTAWSVRAIPHLEHSSPSAGLSTPHLTHFLGALGSGSPSFFIPYILSRASSTSRPERWTDIFLVDNLWSWARFIKERIDMGDKEPSIEAAEKLRIIGIV